MKQTTFASTRFKLVTKRTRKRELLKEMNLVVPWTELTGKLRALKKSKTVDALIDKLEKIKASIRAKVEHPLRVIKCQFGYRKTRYRGLVKNTAQLTTMFALSNLWMVRKRMNQKNGISSGELLSINSRFCGGYSELP